MNGSSDNNLQGKVRQLKERIRTAIESGYFNQAMEGITVCERYAPGDPEVISMKAVVLIMGGRAREAGDMLKLAVNDHPFSLDLLFNLGYAYEQQERYSEAFESYLEAETLAASHEEKTDIAKAMERLKGYGIDIDQERKPRMVFFCKRGLDSFLDDIVKGLATKYMVKKIVVESYRLVDEGMKWADICWFEWCDELIAYGSKLKDAELKKIILRLHSYEAFTGYTANVNWKNVDRIIFVAEHIRDFVLEQNRDIKLSRTAVIPNGVDTSKYRFRERAPGYNIAYVGYINYKKGPMLLLHTFNAIHKKDKRYRLHIAGMFQDARYLLYFRQMVREMGLEGSVFFEGWQEDIDKWLEDKDYILCTSVLESQGIGIMQAMSKGIKPVIHNFVGAKGIYPEKYLWNTIDEAVEAVVSDDYASLEYRRFVEDNYALDKKISSIKDLLEEIQSQEVRPGNYPLVTVGIANYNYSEFVSTCVDSVLEQSHGNIEVLIVDDLSTDNSREIIAGYESLNKNVRGIYHEKNSGSGIRAFQEIIGEAKGKYLMLLSADDYLASERSVEKCVKELEKDPSLDYVYGNLVIVDPNGEKTGRWTYRQFSYSDIILGVFKNFGSGVVPMTVGVYRTDFYRRNNLTWNHDKNNIVAGDTLNTLIFTKHQWKFKYVDEDIICYRQHGKNTTYDLKNRIISIISVLEYLTGNFDEKMYCPEIDWEQYEGLDRYALKMLVIGRHYMDAAFYYYNNMWKPWGSVDIQYDEDVMREYIKPLVEKSSQYLDECIKIRGAFYDMAVKTKEELRQFYDIGG